MAFNKVESASELKADLAFHRWIIVVLIGVIVIVSCVAFYNAKNHSYFVVNGDTFDLPLAISPKEAEQKVGLIRTGGFAKNIIRLLFQKDYQVYQNNIALAQSHLSDRLRTVILDDITRKDTYKELWRKRNICKVEIPDSSIEAHVKSDYSGYNVDLDAITECWSGDNPIHKRERHRLELSIRKMNETFSNGYGLALDSFRIKETTAEPYPDTQLAQQAQQTSVPVADPNSLPAEAQHQ